MLCCSHCLWESILGCMLSVLERDHAAKGIDSIFGIYVGPAALETPRLKVT